MDLTIRPETATDYAFVYEINKIAFGQDAEARLVDLLRQNIEFIPGLSLVAQLGPQIVGHILFSKIYIEDHCGNRFESLALAPLAILPEFQKKGIGKKLVRCGLQKAAELGFKSVIVLGHEHYYPKFGFRPAGRWNINAPFEVSANAFMAIELVQDGLNGVSGTVVYSKEFDGV